MENRRIEGLTQCPQMCEFPDGISSNGKDTFWLALVNRRDAGLDWLMPHPFLRKIVWRLPSFLQPNIKRYAFALGLDLNGKVVRNLQDPSPQCFTQIANVVEHKGQFVLRQRRGKRDWPDAVPASSK